MSLHGFNDDPADRESADDVERQQQRGGAGGFVVFFLFLEEPFDDDFNRYDGESRWC